MHKDTLPKRRAIAKFDSIGDKVAGEVMPPGPEWQDDKFNPGERVVVFVLGDGMGEVQLFARRRQQEAIREALENAGAEEIVAGGWLELAYTGDIEMAGGTGKRWEVAYIPPDGSDVGLPIGVGEIES